MAKSQETFNKKEKEKKRLKKKQDKEQKREERKSIEEMYAYVDENGDLTFTPPDPKKKKVIKQEDIEIGVSKQEAPDPADLIRKGIITFFNESKGYGFIKDLESQESIFVHVNGLEEEVGENDKVTFETEKGQKGLNAIRVKKQK